MRRARQDGIGEGVGQAGAQRLAGDVVLDVLPAMQRIDDRAIAGAAADIALERVRQVGLVGLVERRRGGFCYEANGLFAALLRTLGFNVTTLSAEVANPDGSFGPPFDHMTLMVSLEQRWLVDVGFGDSFREPLLLDEHTDQVQDNRAYRLLPCGAQMVRMQRDDNFEWNSQYRFTLNACAYEDFAEMCRFHQTSPQSHFTQRRICSLATETGRITLSDMHFIRTTEKVGREERTISSWEEYSKILRDQFGIVMADFDPSKFK